MGEKVPEIWRVTLTAEYAPAIVNMIGHGKSVTLDMLMNDPANRGTKLPMLPLLMVRGQDTVLLPELDIRLALGDRILFCGKPIAKATQPLLLSNRKVLTYVLDGTEMPDGIVWRWLSRRRLRKQARKNNIES
jgi:hypothetical protein